MKILIANIILGAITVISGIMPVAHNDLLKDELLGKVKTCTTTTYRVSQGIVTGQTKMMLNKTRVVYNENGMRVEMSMANNKGQLIRDTKFEYDGEGKLITQDNDSRAPGAKTVTAKGKDGITVKTITYSWGNVLIKKIDSKGHVLESLMNNPKGVTLSKVTYKYNAEGKQSFEDDFGAGLKLVHTIMYKYNEMGNNTETTWYKPDGEMASKLSITYNAQGFQSERSLFTAATNVTHTWKYEFGTTDSHGNWLKASAFYDGKLIEIKEREIEY